jgi:hypothetical protein
MTEYCNWKKSMPAIYWLHPANATADDFKLKMHPETGTYFHPGTTDAARQEVIEQYERDCTVDTRYVDVVGKAKSQPDWNVQDIAAGEIKKRQTDAGFGCERYCS